ncbi:MAG: phosphatase PAP2 family protein [Gemmataceae bacterium]|nr:phosphatase PAP2 family protein [Gemmataceae bacterium]MDW8263961.1 phosphatase PAP2 family protein [Gemmataceae bacterium]
MPTSPTRFGWKWYALAGVFGGLFGLVGSQVMQPTTLVELDRAVASRLHDVALHSPGLTAAYRLVTELGRTRTLAGVGLVTAAVMWRWRQRAGALIWLFALIGGSLLLEIMKDAWQRPRPQFVDPIVVEQTYSFPSGHAFGAMVVYGLLAYLATRWLPARRQRGAAVVGLAVLIAIIGFSRVYLGVHWLSDVLGGLAAGLAWVAVCIGLMESFLRRPPYPAGGMSAPADAPPSMDPTAKG